MVYFRAWIAQSAEHVLGKDEVVGSIPTPGWYMFAVDAKDLRVVVNSLSP